MRRVESIWDRRRRFSFRRRVGIALLRVGGAAGLLLSTALGASGRAAPLPRTVCSAVASPAKLPPNGPLLLMVPIVSHDRTRPAASVQLCEVTAKGETHPFYHVLPSTDLDVSVTGRLLTYSDRHGQIHLVDVVTGSDRVIGHGVGPRFSPDSRALAFIGSASAPAPGAPERLEVYRVATAHLTLLGSALVLRAGLHDPAGLFAWAPRGERIAWLHPSATTRALALSVAGLTSSKAEVSLTAATDMGGEPAWSASGDAVLYWHAVTSLSAQDAPVAAYSLISLPVPNGPLRSIIPATSTAWFEGLAPAPISSPRGTVIVSLLGTPRGGLDQVMLYDSGHSPRAIPLPGEPVAVRFAANGTWFTVIWTYPQGNDTTSHAGLVNPSTGKVYGLGPAIGVVWLASYPN